MTRKYRHRLYGLLLLILWSLAGPVQAVNVTGLYHPLATQVEYLEDPTGNLTLEHLLAHPADHAFKRSSEGGPATSFTPIWFKIQLEFDEQVRDKRYYLSTRIENLYDIRLYQPDGQGGYSEQITGNNYPASTRDVDSPRYSFRLTPNTETANLYLRIIGGPGSSNFPWDLIEEELFQRSVHYYYSFDVACFSAIGALLLFNLIIALSLRKAEYLFYSGYVLSVSLGLFTLDGLGFYYLWPETPAFNERALHSFNLMSATMRLLTIMSFLGVAAFAPRMHRGALAVLALLAATLVLVNLFGITGLPPYAATLPWALGILYGFALCLYAIKNRIALSVPLFITLLIPTAAAVMQASLTVSSASVGVQELQLAKTGFVIHVLMFSLCLAAHIKREADSRTLALHDSLTGLPGTTLLAERFELASNLSRRQGMQTAVFFIDLDGFKTINDTWGHGTGDQLLVQAAGRMQSQLRRTDTVARIGGDEFVVLISQLEKINSVNQVATGLLNSLARPFMIDEKEMSVSASIGISIYPDEGEDLHSLLKAADAAMYSSKRRGKNTYTISNARPISQPVAWHSPDSSRVAAKG